MIPTLAVGLLKSNLKLLTLDTLLTNLPLVAKQFISNLINENYYYMFGLKNIIIY